MNSVLSGLIEFAQKVVNALGKIFGWQMEVNAKGLTIDEDDMGDMDTTGIDNIADSADNATDSVKELKDQLQGFDKLNVLRTTKKDNSGSNKKTNNNKNNLVKAGKVAAGQASAALKKTKGLFESNIDNLFDLGRYISNSLAKQLESIKWDKIYEKARGFARGLADFLNGLITPRLFYDLGKTVANSINTALHFLDEFGAKFDFSNFGKSLGAAVNGFFKNIDWKTALSAAKNWGIGVANTLNSFLHETDFKEVGHSIYKYIETGMTFLYELGKHIEWKKVGDSIADAINGFFKDFDAKKFADTIDYWVQGIYDAIKRAIGGLDKKTIIEKIKEFFRNLDFKTIKILLTALALVKGTSFVLSVGKTLLAEIGKQFAVKLAGKIAGSLAGEKTLQEAIGRGLGEATKKAPMPDVSGGSGGSAGGGFFSGLKGLGVSGALGKAGNWLYQLGFVPGTPAFDVLFNEEVIPAIGDFFEKTLPDAVLKKWEKYNKWYEKNIGGGTAKFDKNGKFVEWEDSSLDKWLHKTFKFPATSALFDETKKSFNKGGAWIILGLIEGLGTGALGIFEFLYDLLFGVVKFFLSFFGIASPAKRMMPIGENIIQGLIEGFKIPDIGGGLKFIFDKIGEFFGWIGGKISDFAGSAGGKIKDFFGGIWDKISGFFGNVKGKGQGFFSGAWSKITGFFGNAGGKIKDFFGGAWEKISGFFGNAKDKLFGFFGSAGEKIRGAFGSAKEKTSGFFGNIGGKLKDFFGGAWEKIKNFFANAKDKITGFFKDIPGKVKDFFGNIKDKFKAVGKNIAQGIGDGISGAWKWLKEKVRDVAGNLLDQAKKALGINSPSKVFRDIVGKAIPEGIGVGIDKGSYMATRSLMNLTGSLAKSPLSVPVTPQVIPDTPSISSNAYGDAEVSVGTYGNDMSNIGNRQLANDQKIIQLLTAIAEKEFGISQDAVFRAVRNGASDYTMRTGRGAFEF